MNDHYWLEKAILLAKKAAAAEEVPVGAVLVQSGKILSSGYNQREKHHNPTAHAEIIALTQASRKIKSWRLLGCTLFVTLEPCPMCLAACQQARISRVVYGTKDLKGGALSLGYPLHEDRRMNHRFQVSLLEHPDCSQVLTEFFKKKRLS
jgi:tRNA(adenine34) deaminase